nr:lysophospholipase [Quercus suber]
MRAEEIISNGGQRWMSMMLTYRTSPHDSMKRRLLQEDFQQSTYSTACLVTSSLSRPVASIASVLHCRCTPGPNFAMKSSALLLAGAATSILPGVSARVLTARDVELAKAAVLLARALPANAPNGYTPQTTSCPSATPTIRAADGLSDEELQWLPLRRNATIEPMRDLLARMNIEGLDTDAYINDNADNPSALPNIGIAASGGGYRAMLNGAGYIQAWDSRTPNSTNTGQLGGLLQATTYLSGLSGGSWLVGSLYSNNFTSIDQILAKDTPSDNSGGLWQLGNTIFEGPDSGGIQVLDTAGYYGSLLDDLNGKSDAGFNTSITDIWGRALSYQLINATDGGPAYTWSSLAEQDFLTSGSVPLPLIVADGRRPGETLVSANTTVFTFSPWELGTFDPTIFAFAPLKYVGTDFNNGRPRDECVVGFDNCGFVMGTSSSLFNSALTVVNGADSTGLLSSALQSAISNILTSIGEDNNDIADYPNPFFGYDGNSNGYASSERLTLVDGGEDGQNIPLHPLIQPVREVDVIFAIDSSADTKTDSEMKYPTTDSAANWPDGVSMVNTYRRSLASIQNGTAFPYVPGVDTFMNLGLQSRPTFFGCDAGNITGSAPLIVYLPNAPYSYTSNTSTFDLQYNDTERNAMVLNAYNGATQGNGTLDSQWPACVGCAILSRSLSRTGTQVPDICSQCFDRYCWNGTIDESVPGDYIPELKLSEMIATGAGLRLASNSGAALMSAVAMGIISIAGVSGLTTALLLAKNGVHDIQIVAKHMPGDYDIEYASPWAGANFAPAGVSGLTTALLLAKNGVHDIQIVAKHMPGDYDIEYASPWAGANFAPVKRPAAAPKGQEAAARVAGYEEASWPEFSQLAEGSPEAGVAFQSFRILRRTKDTNNTWLDELLLAKPEPWFKDPLQLRRLSSPELPDGVDLGVELRSVCINTALYLPWLVSRCIAHGVTLQRGDVSHVMHAAAAAAAQHRPPVDVIVNCTGLSARHLGGVEDESLYPARGQIALVRRSPTAAPATMYSLSGTDDADDETCYTMHRPGGGGTVLGGCLQRDCWDGEPDLELGARIVKRAVALDPGLLDAQNRVSVIRHGVGLRPMRDAGPRIEREEVSYQGSSVAIVHNYGHGGYGYQMSYGCAQEAVRLIEA